MNIFQSIWVAFIKKVGKIHWSPKDTLTVEEQDIIRKKLKKNYYVMLSRRNNHLSTYFISMGNFLLTGKFSYWSHAFMNVEDKVKSDDDFRIVEAIGTGVKYTPFEKAFDVNGVVLLQPKGMTSKDWNLAMEKINSEVGKPYDNLFDLKNDKALSCVELVRTALMADPDYATNFANFEAMIAKEQNLTPEMFYDCPDFEKVFEIRR
jgi:uncharacterized protein YycO